MTLTEQRVINDCYILQARIGEDSFTEHWLATVIFNATVFLLRFVKENVTGEESLVSLRQAALAGYHIHDAGLADIVEIETWEGRVFLSSEWQESSPVLSFLDNGIRFSIETVCRHGIRLAFALKAFHENGLVFGGLNCQCAYGNPDAPDTGEWKILKPGLRALLVKGLPDAPDLRDAWACLAPECKRDSGITPASDIYSLGIILVRLLSARVPFPDSPSAVEREPVPLRYVAGSLIRREVPEPLIRVILGMLMHDTAARYASSETVIRDLKRVLAGKDDGFPGNSDKPAHETAAPVRSFDTSDYFNTLSGEARKALTREGLSYPLLQPAESKERPGLIESEMLILPEEASWTVNDYLAYGFSTLPGGARRSASPSSNPVTIPPREATARSSEPDGTPRAERAARPVSVNADKGAPGSTRPLRVNTLRRRTRNLEAEAIRDSLISQTANEDRSVVAQVVSAKHRDTGREHWSVHRILTDDLSSVFMHSLGYARKGKGSFRFIQEPVSPYNDRNPAGGIGAPPGPFLYFDAGNLAHYGTAGRADFLTMLRNSFDPVYASLTPSVRRAVRKRLGATGVSVLFGAPTQDANSRQIVEALLSLGTKTRPLLMVLRGGERIDRDLHDLFLELAEGLRGRPVAVTVFFEHRAFPSWHSLSLLRKGACPD